MTKDWPVKGQTLSSVNARRTPAPAVAVACLSHRPGCQDNIRDLSKALIAVADYGTKFIIVAGLLNIMAAIDAHHIAIGKKA